MTASRAGAGRPGRTGDGGDEGGVLSPEPGRLGILAFLVALAGCGAESAPTGGAGHLADGERSEPRYGTHGL